MNKNLEKKEINGLMFYRPKFKEDWYVSGIDLCKHLGYKLPSKQAKKIYQKYKEYFTETSQIISLPRSVKSIKKESQIEDLLLYQNFQETRSYSRAGCMFFISRCKLEKANTIIEKLFDYFDKLISQIEMKRKDKE